MRRRLSALAWTLFVLSLPPGAAFASERPIHIRKQPRCEPFQFFAARPSGCRRPHRNRKLTGTPDSTSTTPWRNESFLPADPLSGWSQVAGL